MLRWLFAVLLLAVIQPEAVPVTVEAEDSHVLYADFYPATQDNAPAVLLLHQLYTNRTSWHDLIPILHASGYAVLAPDLRGYGQTRGDINWREAQDDTQVWLAWLRSQPGIRADRVALVGSSMGANLAVIGCADDNMLLTDVGCVAAVAISPGQNYFGYTPLAPALADGLTARPVLMISAVRDGYPARAVRTLPEDAPGPVDVIWIDGNAHGMDLLDAALIDQIVGWLNAHTS